MNGKRSAGKNTRKTKETEKIIIKVNSGLVLTDGWPTYVYCCSFGLIFNFYQFERLCWHLCFRPSDGRSPVKCSIWVVFYHADLFIPEKATQLDFWKQNKGYYSDNNKRILMIICAIEKVSFFISSQDHAIIPTMINITSLCVEKVNKNITFEKTLVFYNCRTCPKFDWKL